MPTYNAVAFLYDEMGRSTTMRFQVFGTDADDALSNLGVIGTHLKAITNLGYGGAALTARNLTGAAAPSVGSNTDVGGKCRGISAVDGKTVILRIPDPIAAIVNSTGGFVLDQAAMETFLNDFLTAGDGRVSDGEDVEGWISGALDAR